MAEKTDTGSVNPILVIQRDSERISNNNIQGVNMLYTGGYGARGILIGGGNNHIISNNMKIIAKNPLPQESASLLKLEAPELKINWKSKNFNLKNKKINKTDLKNSFFETNSIVNFP